MTEVTVNKDHKDRLFSFIFGRSENRAWTLELYNAINGSSYDNPDDIEITTIGNSLYLGMKNDVSFILDEYMSLYEHQSTFNPNMPLRQLMYTGRLYDKYVRKHKLNVYGRRPINIPVPKLVVFYNGTDTDLEDEVILNLSDLFEDKNRASEADITVRVRMLNINHGRSKEVMKECKPLAEYSWLIDRIRNNQIGVSTEEEMEIAVDRSLDELPEEFVIRPFLMEHRSEVKMSFLTGYSEAELKEMFKEEGRVEGILQGQIEGRISAALNYGIEEDRIVDDIVNTFGLSENEAREKLNALLVK